MKNASNTDMKQVFEYLENIQAVEPSLQLYQKTLSKIKEQKVIPLFWVRAAACVFMVFLGTEIYLTVRQKEVRKSDLSSVLYTTNNILYHE